MNTSTNSTLPTIIQGGMGVNISNFVLANQVSKLGQQGTLSGVVLEKIMAITLQRGDIGGHIRRALATFPFQDVVERVMNKYFVEGGIPEDVPLKGIPGFTIKPSKFLIELTICANYAFVWLAKEEHQNAISFNLLTDISMPIIYQIFGTMLADVDCITMGAGIPLQIPAMIKAFSEGQSVEYRVHITGPNITSFVMKFDPKEFFGREIPTLRKPKFIPIIASNLLAKIFMKKLPEGSVSGFVIEEPSAGGHNAPPRNTVLDEAGIPLPIYGEKDVVDYSAIAKLGLPFWIGGSKASPEKLKWALGVGAAGIQAGSIFALCEESGMDPEIKKRVRKMGFEGKLSVTTDTRVSPTGFPFKVANLDETISENQIYENRIRICNQMALVKPYETPDGKIRYRCPSEPVESFVAKGGKIEDTFRRGCICNGLMATAGFGNLGEAPIVTLGDGHEFLPFLLKDAEGTYTAKDAIDWLLS